MLGVQQWIADVVAPPSVAVWLTWDVMTCSTGIKTLYNNDTCLKQPLFQNNLGKLAPVRQTMSQTVTKQSWWGGSGIRWQTDNHASTSTLIFTTNHLKMKKTKSTLTQTTDHNITYSFKNSCQTAGVNQNKMICRPSNIQVNKHTNTKWPGLIHYKSATALIVTFFVKETSY